MILPSEVLHEILRWLAGHYLDAVKIANRRLNGLVTSRLHERSLRPVTMRVVDDVAVMLNGMCFAGAHDTHGDCRERPHKAIFGQSLPLF